MDPCAMMDTQFFVIREIGGDAIAVIEIPKVAALPMERTEFPMLMNFSLEDNYSHCEWARDPNSGSGTRVSFYWKAWICEQAATPTSLTVLMGDNVGIELDPVTESDAMEAMLLGGLDYFRSTDAKKSTSTSPLAVTCVYVGKMSPADDSFPTIPVEPADSQIRPALRRARRELMELEQKSEPGKERNPYELKGLPRLPTIEGEFEEA